jgi:hypothetical protein
VRQVRFHDDDLRKVPAEERQIGFTACYLNSTHSLRKAQVFFTERGRISRTGVRTRVWRKDCLPGRKLGRGKV